ncbi:MAG TPA: hypothetical protein VI999_03540 [Thermoplasmata archaeon]|nr:hypothetical protein [Thermoplasmata archaeon]
MEYYWDGPKTGVATFKGEPHAYECVFDDRLDDWSWFYLLKPIDPETLQLVTEKWQIWLRWEDAHQTGQTTISTHPALPADRPRFMELTGILNSKLEVPASSDLAAHGEFERLGLPGASGPWAIVWTTIDRASLGHVARVGSFLRTPDIDPNLYQRRYD